MYILVKNIVAVVDIGVVDTVDYSTEEQQLS
jgi:hypothetical protein